MTQHLISLTKCRKGLFSRNDCFAGASFSTSTALDASIGVNLVDIAFRDSFNRTNGETCSTSYTVISNYVSHDLK